MFTRSTSQRGEIATLLTIASLIIVAAGALVGGQLTKSQAPNSQAAGLRCVAGEVQGPKVGKDCSGAVTGAPQPIHCGMRVIADTFNVEDVVRSGKTYVRIEGNFCFTGNLTTGASRGELFVTNEHPGKPACYKTLAIDTHASFAPGSIPICDQTGQWATTNPKLPIPNRFRGPDKNNYFSFVVEKPANGCLYLNTTTNGQQGGGGAGTNFDIWNDPRLCNRTQVTPTVTQSPTITPIPTCVEGQNCPTLTPTPTSGGKACNDICTGVGQCTGGNICYEVTGVGGGVMRCRNPRNLDDPTCREVTPTPTCTTETCPTNTPTPTNSIPTPTGGQLSCNSTCNPAVGLSCPTGLTCIEVSGALKCRRLPNYNGATCTEISPTPSGIPTSIVVTPTGGACIFNPISFIMVRDSSGNLSPLRSPDPAVWGTVNNKVVEERALRDDASDWRDFDASGEYYPCKNQPGGVCTINTSTCCGLGSHQYNIVSGDTASVTLHYDSSKYRIVQQCYNNSTDSSKDLSSCNNVADDPVFKNLYVKCGEQYRYGWVVEEKGNPQSCPLLKQECRPTDIKADIKSGSSNRATISWDYPSSCPELRAGTDKYWIGVVDQNENYVCIKSVIADESDTSTECKLGRDIESLPGDKDLHIDRVITEWEDGMSYQADVFAVRADDNACLIGAPSDDFSKGEDNLTEKRSHQLDLWEDASQGDDCYIAADTGSGTNQKIAPHCRTSRRPSANGLDELVAKYANRTGHTLKMNWQINSCNGKLLDELGGVCNGDSFRAANGEKISLPNGKMLVCTWTNPKENPHISCVQKDIDFEGGDDPVDPTTPTPIPPSEKGVIKGSVTIGVGTSTDITIEEVLVKCGVGPGCPDRFIAKQRGAAGNAYDYETESVIGKDYTLLARVEYRRADGILRFKESEDGQYRSRRSTKETIENFVIQIPDTEPINGTMTISGNIVVNRPITVTRINEVGIEYNGTSCTPGQGCSGKVIGSIGTADHWNYSVTLPKLTGDNWLVRAYVEYISAAGLLTKSYDPTTTYAQILANGDKTKNFTINIGGASPTASPTTNGVSVNYTVANASTSKKLYDLTSIICKENASWNDYNGSMGNSNSSSGCLRLGLLAKEIGNTLSLSGQAAQIPDTITKSFSGFSLTPGQKVKVGCRFETNSLGPIKFAKLCKLKDATVGGPEIPQNIIITVNDNVQVLSTGCDVNNDGSCNTIDYLQVSQHVGQKGSSLTWDLNGDRKVDGSDISLMLNSIGN